jgi:hypothetical protein
MYYSSLLRNFMLYLFVVFAPKQTSIDERFIDGIIGENIGELCNKQRGSFIKRH